MSANSLRKLHKKYRVCPSTKNGIKHRLVSELIDKAHAIPSEALSVRCVGESAEGRDITLLTIGIGPTKVFMWTQMHGDEPTHTAVLFDLLNFLLLANDDETAQTILSETTLYMLPLVNPDGAERNTRHNAQGVDLNRDALRQETVEGKLLLSLAKELQPDFAFNLHNQNARTAVAKTNNSAAVSLLVPPCDAEDSQLPHVIEAKHVASRMVEEIAQHAPHEISRYDVDFMPRAFGEAVQQSGAATILVEAGYWNSGKGDTEKGGDMVELHFACICAALLSIAKSDYPNADIALYENLPGLAPQWLFEGMITKTKIENGLGYTPILADIGFHSDRYLMETPGIPVARIEEIGDLHVRAAKREFDGKGTSCLPGAITLSKELTPQRLLSLEDQQSLVKQGITTAIGLIDLSDAEQVEHFVELSSKPQSKDLLLNFGFVGDSSHLASTTEPVNIQRILQAATNGLLTILNAEQLSQVTSESKKLQETESLHERAISTNRLAKLLKIPSRGNIYLGSIADLALFSDGTSDKPKTVLVNGNVALHSDDFTTESYGMMLV